MIPGDYELVAIGADELDIPEHKSKPDTNQGEEALLKTYIASGPSQPPKDLASPPTSIAESVAVIVGFSGKDLMR